MPAKPVPPLTHFLCLPLTTPVSRPQLQASISQFATDVRAWNATHASTSEGATGDGASPIEIPQAALRPVGALHFTLGMMSLRDPQQVEEACTFLQEIDPLELLREAAVGETGKSREEPEAKVGKEDSSQVKPPPLNLTLSGLHAMRSPPKTSNLFAAPTLASPALKPLCLTLQALFRSRGLLVENHKALLLHATVLNTIYAKKGGKGKKKSKIPLKIDATELIEKYKDFEWVRDMRIDRIAICKMGAKLIKEGDEVVDQVYTEVCSVPLP